MGDADRTFASGAVEPLAPLPDDWDRALGVVAHPDDLEYGASAAVARWTAAGKQVAYVLVTRGEAGIDGLAPDRAGPVREREQRTAAAAVGVQAVEFLGYPDGTVEYGLPLRRDIAWAIRRHRPHVVVSLNPHLWAGPGAVNTADHRAVGAAVLDAARDAGNRWVFPVDGLEPWAGVRMICYAACPSPTHAVDVTGYVEPAVASLRAHRRYLDGLGGSFDPDRYLREATARTGARAGCEYAVAFEVFTI